MDRRPTAPDVISDATVHVEPRRRLPSAPLHPATAADLAAAAAAVASYRFTVGPDEAFPQPPSLLGKPQNSSPGQYIANSRPKLIEPC